MEQVPNERIQIQARKGNPVIATAKKNIPGKWTKAKKWIKAHQQTIFLTLETLGALAISYFYYKKGLQKVEMEYYKATKELIDLQAKQALELGGMLKTAHGATMETLRSHNQLLGEHKAMQLKIKALQEALKDPRFAEFLAKKHSISELNIPKGGK